MWKHYFMDHIEWFHWWSNTCQNSLWHMVSNFKMHLQYLLITFAEHFRLQQGNETRPVDVKISCLFHTCSIKKITNNTNIILTNYALKYSTNCLSLVQQQFLLEHLCYLAMSLWLEQFQQSTMYLSQYSPPS